MYLRTAFFSFKNLWRRIFTIIYDIYKIYNIKVINLIGDFTKIIYETGDSFDFFLV